MSKNDKLKKLQEKYSDDDISEYETDTDEEYDEDDRVSQEFNDKVLEFLQVDDSIRDLSKEVSALKKKRKPLEAWILNYLSTIGEKVIDIHGIGARLRRNKSETKKQLKQDQIKEAIMEQVNDPIKVEKILKSMEDKREKQIHVNIKRTSKKNDD
ncbi:MAG: hypothetical protein CMF62_03005 [Magnetococcales bacterium]|nr:hypothetical protein [Magnetococcales bacterium]|tara:strand:+ start:15567 stop:16031 length:465 start_codon:yes stop_codon:yes gene_type:complete